MRTDRVAARVRGDVGGRQLDQRSVASDGDRRSLRIPFFRDNVGYGKPRTLPGGEVAHQGRNSVVAWICRVSGGPVNALALLGSLGAVAIGTHPRVVELVARVAPWFYPMILP